MTALLQAQTTIESARSDDAMIDVEIEATPLSDWDVVDAASFDSFPASDPPSWWAGGSSTRWA